MGSISWLKFIFDPIKFSVKRVGMNVTHTRLDQNHVKKFGLVPEMESRVGSTFARLRRPYAIAQSTRVENCKYEGSYTDEEMAKTVSSYKDTAGGFFSALTGFFFFFFTIKE